ncbi:hypothetical protein DQN76_14660 [Clostridium tetani]|nr:hypothetical protein DQN76_14660 [Clostridium tetani]
MRVFNNKKSKADIEEALKEFDKSMKNNIELEALREIDTHIRSTQNPIPYIIETLQNALPEYQN